GTSSFKEAMESVSTVDSFKNLSSEVSNQDGNINIKISELDSFNTPKIYLSSHQKLKTFLNKYLEYLNALNEVINNYDNVQLPDGLNELENKANDAKNAADDFINSTKFITENFSSEIFSISKIKKVIEDFQAKEKT
ncbi:MAG: hypothetical protein GTN59_07520, partial [Candidatus Dadabacteria bacterium]|nr:hypothetical protein [Candidatus Dadabacteria bacterium]